MALAISLQHKNWMGFSPSAPEGVIGNAYAARLKALP